jgi:hypothetical protein
MQVNTFVNQIRDADHQFAGFAVEMDFGLEQF